MAETKEKSVADLLTVLAEKSGLSKTQTKSFLDSYAEVLTEELNSSGSVQLVGVGKLKVGQRAERQGRNPATGATITIPASKTIKLSVGKKFKDSIS